MKIKTSPSEVWDEYQKGAQYKTSLNIYEQVKKNENFFNGRQWEGVKAPNLPKPVFNIIKPVINYYTAMLISDDIAANIEMSGTKAIESGGAYDMPEDGGEPDIPKILKAEIDAVMEYANVRYLNRKMIRNCAVDGDACFYIRFDVDAETGFEYKGRIKVDLIDNTNVYFGDPSLADAQSQPYIILAYRRQTAEVREEAKALQADWEGVAPDGENLYMNSDRDNENDYTTVLLKLWKENGYVHMLKCTEKVALIKPVNTEYKLYPVCWMSWESVKNSYHGVSPVTAAIQNQIFVNKLYAMAMISVQNTAFPKIIYNSIKIDRWDGRPGHDVAANGDVSDAVFSAFKAPEMSGYVSQMIDSTIKYTKDLMGASDAALGNVKPDNTSAIVATQKAAGMPLDLQRMDFYNFIEDYIRIMIDIMRAKYGIRYVPVTDGGGEERLELFDFTQLDEAALKLKIDIGQSAFFSELTQIQTLDNLMDRGIIPDAVTYLEALPDGYVKNKEAIVDSLKENQIKLEEAAAMEQQAALMSERQTAQAPPPEPPENIEKAVSADEAREIAGELAAASDEEAAETIEAMDLPETTKAAILEEREKLMYN